MTKLRAWTGPWRATFLLAGVALLIRNLYGLDVSPPGAYIDEASVGYNAWTIAHFGVDEHGHHWPLFFQAFGEYKNPVYIYLLVPFVRIFGLSIAVIRTPAALLGFVACLAITATVWHIFRSRWLAFLTLVICAFTPWLTQESRLGFEVISMVTATSVAVYCLARVADGGPRWISATGLALALVIYGYTSGRIEAAGLTLFIALVLWLKRTPKWWLVLLCPALGYAVLLGWSFANPHALTARFDTISITTHAHSFVAVAHLLISNYLAQTGPSFLFFNGDDNLRHNTGFSGELMLTTAPLLVIGIIECVRTWRNPISSVALWGLITAPVAAAATTNGIPHSLRAATMVPFAIIISATGMNAVARFVHGRRIQATTLALSFLLVLEGALYTADQFGNYVTRSALWFDTGIPAAISFAKAHAGKHWVFLSSMVEGGQIYILAFLTEPPPPPTRITGNDDHTLGITTLKMAVADPFATLGDAGDEMVLGLGDPQPVNSKVTYIARAANGKILAEVVRFD